MAFVFIEVLANVSKHFSLFFEAPWGRYEDPVAGQIQWHVSDLS